MLYPFRRGVFQTVNRPSILLRKALSFIQRKEGEKEREKGDRKWSSKNGGGRRRRGRGRRESSKGRRGRGGGGGVKGEGERARALSCLDLWCSLGQCTQRKRKGGGRGGGGTTFQAMATKKRERERPTPYVVGEKLERKRRGEKGGGRKEARLEPAGRRKEEGRREG